MLFRSLLLDAAAGILSQIAIGLCKCHGATGNGRLHASQGLLLAAALRQTAVLVDAAEHASSWIPDLVLLLWRMPFVA